MRIAPAGGLALALSRVVSSCNAGLAGIFAASDSDDSTSNAPSTIGAFAVMDAEQTPATGGFQLLDAEADPANVSFFYQIPGGPVRELTQLVGVSNPESFTSSAAGVEHDLTWNFVDELDLPSDGSYVPSVLIWGQLDGLSVITLGANANNRGMGNDPKEIEAVDGDGEFDVLLPSYEGASNRLTVLWGND